MSNSCAARCAPSAGESHESLESRESRRAIRARWRVADRRSLSSRASSDFRACRSRARWTLHRRERIASSERTVAPTAPCEVPRVRSSASRSLRYKRSASANLAWCTSDAARTLMHANVDVWLAPSTRRVLASTSRAVRSDSARRSCRSNAAANCARAPSVSTLSGPWKRVIFVTTFRNRQFDSGHLPVCASEKARSASDRSVTA